MSAKRMRVFAGPNGSGKTTIFKELLKENEIPLGVYVNADEIEATLQERSKIDFSTYDLMVTGDDLKSFFKNSRFAPVKRKELDLWTRVDVQQNQFTTTAHIDSYLSADLAEFIRQQLLSHNISFTYETVMSYPGKIDFLQEAMNKGYRVYLYFIATEDPDINISRVRLRVSQQGHAVSPEVVRSRYYRSLKNLKAAVQHTSRAYIFDNSEKEAKLVAEITEGTEVRLNNPLIIPNWVAAYLFNTQS